MNTDFSESKNYLLILDYYENGRTDVEWYENFDDEKRGVPKKQTQYNMKYIALKTFFLLNKQRKITKNQVCNR